MRQEYYVSWDEVHDGIKQIAEWVRDYNETMQSHNFTKVFGVPRGGALLAVMLSHEFEDGAFPLVMNIDEYDGGVLVLDDIIDSGYTVKPIDETGYHIAALYCREDTTNTFPSFWVRDAEDYWIVFPWETNTGQQRNGSYKFEEV